MDILIGLVIAMFIITAAYVGYFASQQQPVKEVEGHDIAMELEILNKSSESIQLFQKSDFSKLII